MRVNAHGRRGRMNCAQDATASGRTASLRAMLWLDSAEGTAPALPAVWLIPTGARPRNLVERSALRRETARHVIARQLGCAEADVVIDHEPAGRPQLVWPGRERLHLSLATRAGIVAIALAERAVGADVERLDVENPPPLDLLHRDEQRFLSATEPALRALAFARLWAAKEAYVKALGTGFERAPESFAITPLSESRFRVIDPVRGSRTEGEMRTMKNGGQDILAAAAIVLD